LVKENEVSRSFRKPFILDNKGMHESKTRASKVHRRNENVRVAVLGEEYIPLPSKAYTNPWDICDYRWISNDKEARRK